MLGSVCAVANRGLIHRPHLLKEVRSSSDRLIHEIDPEVMVRISASPGHWDLIQDGLEGVIADRRGTGRLARLEGVQGAGKTATAQNPHGEDHAAFAAYAPADDPEVAVLVYLENAGGGGAEAAPIAKRILEAYFDLPTGQVVAPE